MGDGAGSDPPSVSLSFANNFWGRDDAGVGPVLERMHNAKVTSDELKSFYAGESSSSAVESALKALARAALEDEYSRKLLNLSRKPLGSSEGGTLRMSLDVVRGEVESMGKAHQNIATQMKSELEEPLAAFAGGMKERRKIVQGGIEKLLKVKTQQTMGMNKARDRYEQDCLKIKGFLAQAHMVMGQEERKNKAKLEKTQIQLSTTSNEYEAAVKVLEETTGKWNRDWKAACDKFQDLEEERIDYMKSSLWTFANIASTVCVSDDAACEKVRLSLEDCDVEKDITNFISENGTGQEIPDPPKFINFCRGDVDAASEASDEGQYSVAQFQRTMNPAFRSSSPQPSVFESHHDPNNPLAREMGLKDTTPVQLQDFGPSSPQPPPQTSQAQANQAARGPQPDPRLIQAQQQAHRQYQQNQVPHNDYPLDGMTQFCRIGASGNPMGSPGRPTSRDSHSDISNPDSFSSIEPPSGTASPGKPAAPLAQATNEDRQAQKKKSGFFQGHSPFRRRSKHETQTPGARNTWGPASRREQAENTAFGRNDRGVTFSGDERSASPEPVDPRANFQLNIGENVFDVASPDARKRPQSRKTESEEVDPIAQALAELKGVTKQASLRVSADRYHGLATPAPPGTPGMSATPVGGMPAPLGNGSMAAAQRGTPPPCYEQPMSRLGAPQPAFTSRQMQQTTQKYIDQKANMFNTGGASRPSYEARHSGNSASRPPTRSTGTSQDMARSSSPVPPRAVSPRPGMRSSPTAPNGLGYRSASPNPYAAGSTTGRPRAQTSSPIKPYAAGGGRDAYSRGGSPSQGPMPRATSPNPTYRSGQGSRAVSPAPQFHPSYGRPTSSRGSDMALQLAPGPGSDHGSMYGDSQRGRGNSGGGARPTSYYGSGPGPDAAGYGAPGGGQVSTRTRSRSVADPRQYTKDGRVILHYARAMYIYQAQIPEELSFAKGEVLAVLRLQDDGWWEAEVVGKSGRPGLVPSNYLQNC